MLILALCALVLDAFEIIFVVIPIVMPPLLVRIPDAAWVSVIALLILQTSFVIPPLGYAVLLIRGEMPAPVPMRKLARALLPYVAAQALVLALVLCFPSLTHLLTPQETAPSAPAATDEDPWKILQEQREQQEQETRQPSSSEQEMNNDNQFVRFN